MSVDELQTMVDDDALGSQLAVHLGIFGCIQWHEVIWHDTTATINHTMLSQSVILQGISQVDAVLVGELTMLVSLVKIHRIVLTVTFLIWFLNTSATWGIVMGDGETNLTAILEGERTLHQSLAEGTTTYHHTTVLVLDGTRNDFGGRGSKLIGEHHNLALAPTTIGLSTELLTRSLATIGIDNQIAFLQELIGNLSRRLEITTSIVLQVEDEVFHALLLQGIHRLRNFLVAGHTETSQTDIADTRTNHVGCIHRCDWNLVTLYIEGQLVLDATAHNSELHHRSLRTTKSLHDFLLTHLHASDGSVVDCHDAVARHDAHLLRRTIGNGLDDEQSIIHHIKLHADTIE